MAILYSLIISIFVFLLCFICGLIVFNNKMKHRYNLLNHFPYELETQHTYPFLNCLFALSIASLMIFHLDYFFIEKTIHSSNFVNNFFGIILLIQDILCFMIFNSRIHNSFKTHIIFASFYFASSLASNLYAIYFIIFSHYFSLYFLIYFIIFSLLEIILIFLPQMKKTFIIEKSDKNNRNKYNHLAFCEWLFIFSFFSFNIILYLIRVI